MTVSGDGLNAGAAGRPNRRLLRPAGPGSWGTAVMRFVGMTLVMLGGLALGYHGFRHVASNDRDPLAVPPVASGIAVVSGLLLLASSGRRLED